MIALKTLIALGILGTAGALSICDRCGSDSSRASAALGASARSAGNEQNPTSAADTLTVTLKVEGMTCGGCVLGVRKVLGKLDGVGKTEVSYEKQRAVVTYDSVNVTVEQMIAAIKTLGYKATVVTN